MHALEQRSPKVVSLALIAVALVIASASRADPNSGPGGPILIVSNPTNPFGLYLAEILRTEGFNYFDVIEIGSLDAPTLANHDLLLLGETSLTTSQVTLIETWVDGGGRLIAMRPDPQLASLLGLASTGSTLAEGYLAVDITTPPGAGIVEETIQFHGAADLYNLSGATLVATLFSDATTSTVHPAVTLHDVGPDGGRAAAFSYDLARSVVYTRQGNPAWAGIDRDGQIGRIRPWEMFFSQGPTAGEGHWVDVDRIHIPQADEQQRLLANLMLEMVDHPMPRFWYLPEGRKAAIVMTGDEHSCCDTTEERIQSFLAEDPPGCSVADWQCVRSTSYVYAPTAPVSVPFVVTWDDSDALTYTSQGFEVAPHISTSCADWTPSSLVAAFTDQLASFEAAFPSIPLSVSQRHHCVVWSDWVTQAHVSLMNGVRFDTNYYYKDIEDTIAPAYPGMFTGSGMPMRFADLDGTMIDVYQATTQMTDESGQSYPFTVDTVLDRALGPEGFYGVFTVNMHQNNPPNTNANIESLEIVESAKARGVAIVSASQMLEWIDGRNDSSFASIEWNGKILTFDVQASPGALHLRVMVPRSSSAGIAAVVTRDGQALPYTIETVKGIDYLVLVGTTGSYRVEYGIVCGADTSVSDFSAGLGFTSTAVSNVSNGEIILVPTEQAEFDGPILSAGWETVLYAGGTAATISGGEIRLDGARVNSVGTYGPGRSIEFVATFEASANQHVGFGLTLQEMPWAIFSTAAGGTGLLTRTHNGTDSVTTELGASLLGAPHRYRIDWLADRVDFSIDGAQVGSHATTYVQQMRPVAGDSASAAGDFSVDWIRMTPHESPGSYDSRIFDATEARRLSAIIWNALEPANTTFSLAVRTGDTPVPDGSWSAFLPVPSSGSPINEGGRYIQYRALLATDDPAATSVLGDVTLFCEDRAPAVPAASWLARALVLGIAMLVGLHVARARTT